MTTKPRSHSRVASAPSRWRLRLNLVLSAFLLAGCGPSKVEQALDSDANGYVCLDCTAKFYTDRNVFPTRCPDCKKQHIEQAIGFVCAVDQETTIGPRTLRSVHCKKCGAATTSMNIPRAADFKAWGAKHRTEAEVTGG